MTLSDNDDDDSLTIYNTCLPLGLDGYVYVDTNRDNRENNGEQHLPGVTIYLSGITIYGQVVTGQTITDSNGYYSFTQSSDGASLLPGTYQTYYTTLAPYYASQSST